MGLVGRFATATIVVIVRVGLSHRVWADEVFEARPQVLPQVLHCPYMMALVLIVSG